MENKLTFEEKEKMLFDIGFRYDAVNCVYKRDRYRLYKEDFERSDSAINHMVKEHTEPGYVGGSDHIRSILLNREISEESRVLLLQAWVNKAYITGQYIGYKLGLEHGRQEQKAH